MSWYRIYSKIVCKLSADDFGRGSGIIYGLDLARAGVEISRRPLRRLIRISEFVEAFRSGRGERDFFPRTPDEECIENNAYMHAKKKNRNDGETPER